ncbi:MAG TPA: GAF domain-containing protein [Chthonomonadaceae bacterium]|nr:GAF domain-containing protein [Chthonomonadaceae bacterium]
MSLLVEAATTLIGSRELSIVLPGILNIAGRLLAADAHAVWRFDPATGQWSVAAAEGLSEAYQAHTVRTLNKTSSMPDRSLVVEAVDQYPLLANRPHLQEMYRSENIHSMLVLPLCLHGDVNGTLVFYYKTPHVFPDSEVHTATALANLAASAIANAELYEEQTRLRMQSEQAQRRQAFLVEASRILDSSLEYQTTLANVARLAVPHLADWCAVHILEEDGVSRQLAVEHVDPDKVRWAVALQERYPPDPNAPTGVPNVLRTGKSELYTEIPDEMLVRGARDEEHLEIIRQLQIQSAMVVPLTARGRTLGAITFISAESGHRYTEEDLAIAEELGHRAGIAVDNARLYQAAQQEIADRTLQEEILQRQAQLLELAHDTIFVHDMQNRITFWNQAAEQMYGWPREEALGQVAWHLLRTRFPQSLEQVHETLQAAGNWEGELVHFHRDGKRLLVASRWALQRDEAGQPLAVLEINRDITVQRQAEERQQFLTDLSDRIRFANDPQEILWEAVTSMGKYLQASRCLYAELDLERGLAIVHRDYHQDVTSMAGTYPLAAFGPEIIAEGKQGRTLVVEDIEKDPRTKAHYAAAYAPLEIRSYVTVPLQREGKLVGSLNITSSVPRAWTEEEVALIEAVAERTLLALENARLFQAEHERSEQLAAAIQEVHHRVKNSLQMVTGLLEIQAAEHGEILPTSAVHDGLRQVKTIALVHDLLTRDQPIGNVNAAEVLSRLVTLLTTSLGLLPSERPIHLNAEPVWLPTKAATAMALIVNELVSNAIKHGQPPERKDNTRYGTIQICLTRQEPEVLLSVQDEGPGFPPDFDPIQHAHVGLELVLTLVTNDLQGTLVFSNVPGEGANRPVAGGRAEVIFPERPLSE